MASLRIIRKQKETLMKGPLLLQKFTNWIGYTKLDKKDKGTLHKKMEEIIMPIRRTRRVFTDQFKQQIVLLFNGGKSRASLAREYDLSPSVLDRWIDRINETGSDKEKDNRSPAENELLALRKKVKQLEMENDILKQAALILGQK